MQTFFSVELLEEARLKSPEVIINALSGFCTLEALDWITSNSAVAEA